MPDQQCPVPMDKLEDCRRTIAHKQDGTTEDFEEKLHSLEHSQQKMMLNTAWKGETWFKKDARPPRPPITTSSKALPAPIQQQDEQSQQRRRYTEKKPERPEEMATSMSNGQVVNNNHPEQQASHDQKNFQQQKTVGFVKDICGKEPTSSPEQHSTYHNKHKMGQMPHS